MSTTELLEQLKKLSNPDRLQVIETATRMVREELLSQTNNSTREDTILKVAGCLSGSPLSSAEIDKELYGKGNP